MKSGWNKGNAQAAVERYVRVGVSPELALRVYSTRLLGRDPSLVLHGGGNTSLKARARDLTGEEIDVLYIKGSGHDMRDIQPAGMPAVRLAPLLALRTRDALTDDDFARVQRAFLVDPLAPAPSVEMLLHAFMPARFTDHTHATAVLSLIDQPDAQALCREVFEDRLGFVPYVRPGFWLAKGAAQAFDRNPRVEGLILDKHGIFTFGETAREAYERMIEFVSLAEARLQKTRKPTFASAALPQAIAALEDVAPIIRGTCSERDAFGEGAHRRLVLAFRSSDAIVNFVNGSELSRYARGGLLTPDHVIRTKPRPLILPAPQVGKLDAFKIAAHAAVQEFVADYKSYFAANSARVPGAAMHDSLPRMVFVPGGGLFGMGESAREAEIAADIGEAFVEGVTAAEAIGRFTSISQADLFDCEYWPLEVAKLGEQTRKPLQGQIAVITGAGGAIGAASARVFAQAGAEIALLDLDYAAAQARAREIAPHALAIQCDVTNADSVAQAYAQVVENFGGVDILVSNAGAAWQGKIGEVDESVLRKSFELNFFAHQKMAQGAAKIMRAQGTGGCLLFNVSKQAVNPGPDFGPYGLPKAATLFLVRQYALDHGAEGIRANAVNADRIRSGILTDDFIGSRSKARGVSEKEYMSGNLLRREVTADDVAQAFLAQALALKTTADVTTVDGGNIAAALR
jgi:rhamnose utilization protein RhaD (predicted bifunctional aldolase and dehydrogenase)/NAD(P)-dependent dehydrogenase (short-subunit alcohol dehydrogenase family)